MSTENKISYKEKFIDEKDNVNHPSHYEGKYECIEVMESTLGLFPTLDFCVGNAFKYIWRWHKKNGLEDILKANWYINKAVELTIGKVKESNNDREEFLDKTEFFKISDVVLDSQNYLGYINYLVCRALEEVLSLPNDKTIEDVLLVLYKYIPQACYLIERNEK